MATDVVACDRCTATRTCKRCVSRRWYRRQREGWNGKLCVHCHKYRMSRPRGLCFGCSEKPGVRALYTANEKDRFDDDLVPKPVLFPTDARPGSDEKIAVMAGRFERGEELFHARDRHFDTVDEPPGSGGRPRFYHLVGGRACAWSRDDELA